MTTMPDIFASQEAISLLEFNARIKNVLAKNADLQNCWVKAETSDLRVNTHCYMELIQKNDAGDTVARIGAVAWANVFNTINAKFRAVTGQNLTTGLNVMLKVSVSFNEKFGLKLLISDVNPEFTLGDMVRQRMEILRRLTAEGLIDLNKKLPLTAVPQRVAVISAQGAAGYGDFVNQLVNNQIGVKFYICLFPAVMQGASTAPSVIDAINRVETHLHLFDCIVIIRGGGSTSDLNSFDNYDLAARVARCKLPVIVGIGHERDTTVLDDVACVRVKTPTAAAEFLVGRATAAMSRLSEISNTVVSTASRCVTQAQKQLEHYRSLFPILAEKKLDQSRERLKSHTTTVQLCARGKIDGERGRLKHATEMITNAVNSNIKDEYTRQKTLRDMLEILSPRNTLNRGYSLAMHNGKFVTDTSQVTTGDTVTVHLKNGKIVTKVIS